jgi:hypothetical protein
MFLYTGVFVQTPLPVVSPNGDGVDDGETLRYKLVRPSTTTVTLTAPDGTVAYSESAERQPGGYGIPFPSLPAPPTPPSPALPPPSPSPSPPPPEPPSSGPVSPTALSPAADPAPANGRWKLSVSAIDDTGQLSQMTQAFVVNTTLGFLGVDPPRLFLPPGGRDVAISWRQAGPARVVVTVESQAGEVVRILAQRPFAAGPRSVTWDGLGRDGKAVKGGPYVVRVAARNDLGRTELARRLRVRRIVGPPRP